MKKLILPLIIFLLLSGAVVLAQEAELPSPGLTPDSPFYFLERASERIGTFFTFGEIKKAVRYAKLADERIAEAKAVVEKGKPESAQIALKRYEDQLVASLARAEKAKAKGKSIEKITETIAEATGQHLIVLEEVLEKVPEGAKVPIIEAKEVSAVGQKNALRVLARENPERATEINLKAAEARLDRAKVKTEEGKAEEAEKAIKEFENQHKFGEEISQIAQGLGKDTTTVEQLVGKATSIHLEVLAEVYEKAPEEAKPAIEEAMGVSVKGHEKAVEALKEKEALGEIPEEVPIPEKVPEEVKERIREGIVVGGPCSYDTFKGKCKITSIINESIIKFKFTPTEPIDIEWVKKSIDREIEEYARYLGWKCLEKYPIAKEDLEKCGIKENVVLDCEIEVITSGTCTPIIFKFHEPAIIEPEVEIVEERKECLKEGETYMPGDDKQCCAGLKGISLSVGDGRICSLTAGYVCTAFCGDGKCEGEYENPCSCPEDCFPGDQKEKVPEVPVKIYNQNISGEIKQDQIWSGTIHVTGDIEVKEGVTLTILPGTVVEVTAFSDDRHGGIDHPHDSPFPKDPDRIETQSTNITVNGTLNAVGTQDNRILFTSDKKETTYDWDGLHISHGRLEYAIVEYARYNNFQEFSDVVVANNIFRNILECCICIGHSKPISPQILYNDIYNCGHEGIDNAGGSPLIKGNYFHRENPEIQPDPSIGGVGIVVYKNAYPIVEDNVFEKNSNAIIFIGASMHEEEQGKEVIIRNNIIKNNDVGINIDPDYPFDAVIMENNQLINNKEDEAQTG